MQVPALIDLAQDVNLSVLVVRLADELFALPAEELREVVRWRQLTPVPGASQVLPGIIAQRGSILPVVELCRVFGFRTTTPNRMTRYVVAGREGVELALLVDEVLDLVTLDRAVFEPPPAGAITRQSRLLGAVARYNARPLALLDLKALIAFFESD